MATFPYYVYEHLRKDTNERFYIGKGKKSRAWKPYGRSKHWNNIANKHGFTVQILATGLTEQEAFEKEKQIILFHGTVKNKTGSLINLTDGGDGCSGRIATKETRDKISKSNSGKLLSEDLKEKLSKIAKKRWQNQDYKRDALAKMNSQQAKDKKIKARKTQWADEEKRTKLLDARALSKDKQKQEIRKKLAKKVLCIQTGVVFDAIADAEKWLRSIGLDKADHTAISKVCKGKMYFAYGYSWAYYKD